MSCVAILWPTLSKSWVTSSSRHPSQTLLSKYSVLVRKKSKLVIMTNISHSHGKSTLGADSTMCTHKQNKVLE